MKKLIRAISIVLTIAYLIMIPLSVQSVLGATSTASDNSLLSKWKGYGLLDNSIKNDELYKPIQKIDFIMYINNILKSSKQVEVGFSDVPKGSWYAAEISKAVASGFVTNQDNENYLPFSNITRLDAAIMVARVFGLELSDKKILDTITDAEKLSNEELNNFGAVIEKGYLSEISKGRYAPTGVLKMIDAMKMLDTCMGKLVTKASTITSSVTGNMLVNTKSVTLNNMVVTGDLIIGEGVLDGTIRLQNVSVKGNLIIRGGGNNGVTLKDTKIGGKLIVEKGAGDVAVVATGTTTINQTFLKSGCSLEEVSLTSGSGFINVTSGQAVIDNQTASLSGTFNSVTIGKSNIDMKLTGSTDDLKITKEAQANLSLVGSAGTITTQASKNIIDMSNGIVTTFNVEDGAKGNKININGTAIIINMTVNGNSALSLNGGTVNKLTLGVSSEGSSVNIKSGAVLTTIVANAGATVTGSGKITTAYIYADNFSTDIRPNGYVVGNGISTTINGTAVSSNLPQIAISANDIVLKEGGIQLINATASPSDSTMTYISSDNSIVTISEKGLITAVSTGTASIYITAQRPGYSPCSTSIKVEVSNSNVTTTGTLAISPDSAETGTKQNFQIIYTAGDNMSNGTVVIKLPTGFSVYENDTVSIAGSESKVLEASQRPNTQTLSFTNLNLTKGQTIIVNFNNRLVPTGGEYIFTAISDADGTGPRLPTTGQEKGTFNSNSLRVLILGTNYSKPEYGTEGGTTKITKLTTLGFTGSNKWLISVKDGAFAAKPNFDDSLTGSEYVEYKEGTNIKVNIGQYMRLVAVDSTDGKNKVKAYKDILIEKEMVRPYSADKIVLASDSVTTGIQSNAVRIKGLDSISITGADKWMIKVQNAAAIDVFVDSEFVGAKAYTSDEDISVYAGQHVILAAVDSKNNNSIKAYTDITVENTIVSKSAGKLLLGNNYELPTYGSTVGKTTIKWLDKGNLPGGFEDINKWMVVVLSKATVEPAMDISTTEFERYTEGKTFADYAANEDIAVAAGQNILLVGVKEQDNGDGTKTSKIKAYANLTVDSAAVRQADAPEIPDVNFSAPEMGSTAGTTKLPSLDFDTKIADATKYMVKVQNDEFAIPQMNSILSGAVNCIANQNIKITDGQHLVLLATDDNGCIKAYKDIEVSLSQIRPGDALKLNSTNDSSSTNDYSGPIPGDQVGSTRVNLSSNRVPGWVDGVSKWMYKLQSKPYDVPYMGSKVDGLTQYISGEDIKPVTDGQYLLIVAVDGDGKTLAYTVERISYLQIKQPLASDLKSSSEVGADENYNYLVPVPGQTGGTTRITSLSTRGIQGATKWLYQITAAPAAAPEYNSIITGILLPYVAGDSIKVTEGQYFVLYAVDDYNKIKAFDNIPISKAQIRTPNALDLVTPTNYAAPTAGTLEGTTVISSLSFARLTGVDDTWSWMYVVGDKMFGAPMLDTNISTITNAQSLTTTTNIPVKAEQYILLLAIDGTNAIKGYANIYVPKDKIRPYKADPIPPTSYTLIKGTEEGTTCFSNLNLIGIEASTWMIKTQKGAFDIPAKDFAVSGSVLYSKNANIKIGEDEHILLLATDSLGRVKAYADITVNKDQIKAPFATPLTEITNFTKPEQGNEQGTVKIMLNDYGVKKESGETIVWKYKIGTEVFNAPHLDDDASGIEFIPYASNQDIKVSAGNSILIVAVAKDGSGNEKIKAFTQFIISASQIKPANAPELTLDYNYSSPTAGSKPGTTKITNLKLIGIVGQPTKWQIRVSDENETLILNSLFTNPINYTDGMNIDVKLNQYVILAAVDDGGKVKAYKSIQISQDTQINPPLAEFLDKGLNYTNPPKYGSVTGTTSVFVSPEGLNGCKEFIAKVVDAPVDIIAGTKMAYTEPLGSDYKDFHIYSSGSDISASQGQFILLVAVDENKNIIAYANVPVTETSVRPGNAIALKPMENYTKLEPGAGVGTTKFATLDFVGIPVGTGGKWLVKVQDVDLTSIPLINSSVEGAAVYSVNSDIAAKEGQYVVLYAVDTTGKIKGYVSLPVSSANVRGVAPLLKVTTHYSVPEPGSDLNKTMFSTLTLPEGATLWKYSVQDTPAGTVLKDGLLSGYTPYEQGHDIAAKEGQHLILIATDNAGGVKAYVDIIIEAKHLRNVQATLSGTIISAPTGESHITVGGRTIIITLAYGEWQEDVLTNTTKRNALFDGLIASGDEQAQWGKVIAILKTEGAKAASMSSDKKTITITLSETATYDITKSQEVSLIIKPELIKNAVKSATSVNSIKIAADVIVKLDGTAVTQGLGEGDIVAGGRTIIIYLTNGEFASDVATNEAKRNAIFNSFKATNNTDAWTLVIDKLKLAGEAAITRNASNKVTIVLPAVAGYDITMNETINVTVPYMVVDDGKVQEILVGSIKDAVVSTQLPIYANASADLSGTLLEGVVSETNIVTGSKTLVIKLADGQWVTDIATNATKRNALFAGLAASTENFELAKVIKALQDAGQAAITRTDNNTVTIILPSVSTYDISSNQYITMTIPAACIIGAKASLIAKQTITIERVAGATLTGTAVGSTVTETDIKLGGKTIIITLNNALWIDDISTNSTVKNALFDGMVADVEQNQWLKIITALKNGLGSVTKTSTNSITITLPTVIGYDITAEKQNISVTVPISAIVGSSFNVQASNTLVINSTPPTAAKVVEVKAATNTYKLGDVVTINVRFDTAVDVIGIPVLNLETGTTDRNAYYTAGSGTDILTFTYTVQEDDSALKLDYLTKDSLVLQGATIINSGSSVKAITTLPVPGNAGSLSNTSNVLIDAVAPKFSTGYPQKGTITELTADIVVNVNEKATIYYVTVLNDINNSVPTVEQVKGGLNAAGTAVAAGMLGTVSVIENKDGKLAMSNLSAYTDYTVYIVLVDSLGNTSSTVSSFNFKTADTTAPQFIAGYPQQVFPASDNLINILIKANEAGNVYLVALPAGSVAPTSDQVKAFKNGSGGAVATNLRATAKVEANAEITLGITGLTVSTHYDIYVVCVDASGNILATPAFVTAETLQLNMDNVGVNLAKKIITNTTTQMQYSFDEQNWINCTATSTNITYDDNAVILAVFVREAKNTTNVKELPILTREDETIIDKTAITYDIANGTIKNTSAINLQYRINGGTWGTLNASGSASKVVFEPGLLEVRTAASELKLPSAPVLIDNIAVPMPAPNLVYDDSENRIEGLDSTYEFRINGGTWTTGVTDGIFAGTKLVEVRQKAETDKLPSVAQVINFTAGTVKVVAEPWTDDATLVATVTITFEENTNKVALTAQNINDWFTVGTWSTTTGAIVVQHNWGTDFTAVWNTAGNVLTIKYKTMADSTVEINDEVRIDALAGIKNATGTSASYTSTGLLTGSFHTVPAIKSVQAVNANNTIGFNNGDQIVITFDQPTIATAITKADIDTLLKVTDSTGLITRTWGIVNDSDIVWNSDGTKLTITFADVTKTDITLKDKLTVSTALGLTDADQTTEACNSSSFISGSFTSTPEIMSVTIANGGVAGTKNVGDTITITFDQATNKKTIKAYQLDTWLTVKTSAGVKHSWGAQSDANITWSADGKTLTIKLSSISGVTITKDDILYINTLAGIKAADGGTAACGDSKEIGGGY